MLISETIYRHQVSAEISPYAMLFMAFFFISLGMGLNLPMLIDNWYIVILGLIGLIAIKFVAIYIVARVRSVPSQDASMIALVLAQGGEFGLLMLQTMKAGGIEAIPQNHAEIVTAIIILSIMVTPILLCIYDYLNRRGWLFAQRHSRQFNKADPEIQPTVVICGFGRVGQIVAQLMIEKDIPYVALDLDVSAVMLGRDRGFNVAYGDCSNGDVLHELGLNTRHTRAVVVALDNAVTARKTILTVKGVAPRVKIFARTRIFQKCLMRCVRITMHCLMRVKIPRIDVNLYVVFVPGRRDILFAFEDRACYIFFTWGKR